jgi:NAD(P)-dependent dehydrogenase (short-subunit alcohol dehydrogenase family)
MTKLVDIAAMIDMTLRIFDCVDILINNAGIKTQSPIDQFLVRNGMPQGYSHQDRPGLVMTAGCVTSC